MKRKKILEQHPYKIWQGADGRWYTKVKSDGKLKILKKTNRDDLDDAIVAFYRKSDDKNTLAAIYPDWLQYKIAETSKGNANKLQWVWAKYYKDSPIANRDIRTLKTRDIKLWLLDVTHSNALDRKKYKEMKSLINMMLDYAVEDGTIVHNAAREIKNISDKHFNEPEEKSYDEQVFRLEVAEAVVDLCMAQFEKTGNSAYLGICLNFYLGLRVGEIVALKTSDFDLENHIVKIRRMERSKYYQDADNHIHRSGYEIVDFTKSKDGKRDLPLTPEAEDYVKTIIAHNKSIDSASAEWLFLSLKGEKLTKDSINNVLRRINKKLDIIQKGNHSIRKTALSNLFKNGFTEEEVRQFAGHKDASTTHKYYEFANPDGKKDIARYSNALHINCHSKQAS
ncbi:MAG: tyrosine-type recombinase/integrase [Clostridiales bacterium]|nr:tyrosine-type recombinase/integrase [Clostridiales bacterium]